MLSVSQIEARLQWIDNPHDSYPMPDPLPDTLSGILIKVRYWVGSDTDDNTDADAEGLIRKYGGAYRLDELGGDLIRLPAVIQRVANSMQRVIQYVPCVGTLLGAPGWSPLSSWVTVAPTSAVKARSCSADDIDVDPVGDSVAA